MTSHSSSAEWHCKKWLVTHTVWFAECCYCVYSMWNIDLELTEEVMTSGQLLRKRICSQTLLRKSTINRLTHGFHPRAVAKGVRIPPGQAMPLSVFTKDPEQTLANDHVRLISEHEESKKRGWRRVEPKGQLRECHCPAKSNNRVCP